MKELGKLIRKDMTCMCQKKNMPSLLRQSSATAFEVILMGRAADRVADVCPNFLSGS